MTTNQTVGSYWFRANVEEACRSYNNGAGRSIFTYAGANVSQPNSTSSQISSCDDEGPLIPRWPTTVPQDTFSAQAQTLEVDVELPGLGKNNGDIIVWAVNMTAMNVDWEFPVLSYVYKGNTSYPDDENLISISNEAKVDTTSTCCRIKDVTDLELVDVLDHSRNAEFNGPNTSPDPPPRASFLYPWHGYGCLVSKQQVAI